MPEHDAFGREIGQDTLAGLGGGGSSQPSAVPASSETAPTLEAAASVVRVRRRSGVGCLVGLVVLIVLVAGPIVALVSFAGSAEDTFDDVTGVFDSAPDAEPDAPAASGQAKPPSGLSGASLVSRAGFGKALARIEGARMGRIGFLRLAPERLDAQLVKGSRQRSAQLDFEGQLTRGPAARGGASVDTVAFASIDRSAPARLVRRSAARFPVREKGIDYLVLMPYAGEGHRWIAYFKNGIYVQGDRNGRVVRRIG
jgi:hypothetical protein